MGITIFKVYIFVVVYKLVNVVLTLECTSVPSQERHHNQVIGINISLQVFNARGYLLLFKCGFDIRVVLCTSVPSVRNATTTKLWP